MAATTYDTKEYWDAGARYTNGSSGKDLLLANPSETGSLRWTSSMSDDLPVVPVGKATVIKASDSKPFTAKPNERIWFARTGRGAAAATVEE